MAEGTSREATLYDRRETAIHEAGHAVAAWRLHLFDDDSGVSIMPSVDDELLGRCLMNDLLARQEFDLRYGADEPPEFLEWSLEEHDAFLADSERRKAKYRQEAEDMAVAWLAGCVASRIATPGAEPTGCEKDHLKVRHVLGWLTDAYPGDDKVLCEALWAWLDVRAEQLLRGFWPAVEALADALLVRGEIAGADALQIMREAWTSNCKKELDFAAEAAKRRLRRAKVVTDNEEV